MLKEAQRATERAISLLNTEDVRAKFSAWIVSRGEQASFDYSHLISYFKNVQVSIESLSRHYVELVSQIESGNRRIIGEVRFDHIAWGLIYDPTSLEELQTAMEVSLPSPPEAEEFHPSDFIGATEITTAKQDVKEHVFPLNDTPPETKIVDFLIKNLQWLQNRLAKGSLPLTELLSEAPDLMSPEDDIESVVGVYSLLNRTREDPASIPKNTSIVIGYSGNVFQQRIGNTQVSGDNIEICLVSSNSDIGEIS